MGASTEIAERIRAAIADGTYAVGDRVPTIRQLADENGVAYATAAKAVEIIRNEGLLETRPGRGTVVLSADVGAGTSVQAQLADLRSRVEALEARQGDASSNGSNRKSHKGKRTTRRAT